MKGKKRSLIQSDYLAQKFLGMHAIWAASTDVTSHL